MSQFLVHKAGLKGEIAVPPSKSHTLRSILFAMLAHGTSTIHHYLPSTDTQAMITACRLFGATLEVSPAHIQITGVGGRIEYTEDVIHAGNSGIVLRFCAAVGALAKHPVVITGDHSIRHQRPMKPLLDGLRQLGVSAEAMRGDDFAPVIIRGPIKPGRITLNGEDSQPVSALLIACAFAGVPVDIDVHNPGEIPWIKLTLHWFDRLGITYEHQDFQHYHLPGNGLCQSFEYHVPGDMSSAAFPIAAALITRSAVTIHNVDMHDAQGDKELINVLRRMGAHIEIDDAHKTLHVKGDQTLHGIKVDINDFVDAITILAVVGCFAEGETHIHNAAVARQKECNRIACIAKELRKMGGDITETEDGLHVRKSALKGAQVHSHHDHRMAMSLAVAGMGTMGETCISSVDCVAKTFPSFLQDFKALGADIRVMP